MKAAHLLKSRRLNGRTAALAVARTKILSRTKYDVGLHPVLELGVWRSSVVPFDLSIQSLNLSFDTIRVIARRAGESVVAVHQEFLAVEAFDGKVNGASANAVYVRFS